MNTTAAATEAKVTVATIRTWCRNGVVAATKQAGRWIIDTASLAHRIAIGQRKTRMNEQPTTDNINPTMLRGIRTARLGYTSRPADRPALAGRYVLPFTHGANGTDVWHEYGLIEELRINGRRYYVLSAKAMKIRAQITAA